MTIVMHSHRMHGRLGAVHAALAAQWRVPLHAWAAGRRTLAAALLAAAIAATGITFRVATDAGGVQAGRTALHDADDALSAARRKIRALPGLRARVAAETPPRVRQTLASGSTVVPGVIGRLVARSGITLQSLEPVVISASSATAMRAFKMQGHADFGQLTDFLHCLVTLPIVVVPDDLEIRRAGDGLSVSATLQVDDALAPLPGDVSSGSPGVPREPDRGDSVGSPDPFAPLTQGTLTGAADAVANLVGVLVDDARGIALFGLAQHVAVVSRGEWLGVERLVRVRDIEVTLEAEGNLRTLGFAKEVR